MTAARKEANTVWRSAGTNAPSAKKIEADADSALLDAIARTPLELYVLWTGSPALTRGRSVLARVFECMQEVGVPIPLRAVVQGVARLGDGVCLQPDAVREAVRRHQSANAAVLLLLRRRGDGAFLAATDILHAVDLGRRISAGELVLEPDGQIGSRNQSHLPMKACE
jgi:hypothetical protein